MGRFLRATVHVLALATVTATVTACRREREHRPIVPVAFESPDADVRPPREDDFGEVIRDSAGLSFFSADERALYLTTLDECGKKHACRFLFELPHTGDQRLTISKGVVHEGLMYVDSDHLVAVPFWWGYGPTTLVIDDRKTGTERAVEVWPSNTLPAHVVRDGTDFFVSRVDHATARSEVVLVGATGSARSVFSTKGVIESLSVAGSDLEYEIDGKLRRRSKLGGVETMVGSKPGGWAELVCGQVLARNAPGATGLEIVDDGRCSDFQFDDRGAVWISSQRSGGVSVDDAGTISIQSGHDTGRLCLRTLGLGTLPKTIGRIRGAAGSESRSLMLSSKWIYVHDGGEITRFRR